MDSKRKSLVRRTDFPDQLAPDIDKMTWDYGLEVGKAIQYEWFKNKGGGTCRFYDQWIDFHRTRLYARGEQPVNKYKKEMAVDGDLSRLNIDWTPVPIIPKFVDIVVNGMVDRSFSVKAYAQDAMSAANRMAYQDMLEADMVAKELLTKFQQDFGVDAFSTPPDQLPSDDKELALHMQLDYKPSIEIAEEEAINTVLDMNRYEEIKRRIYRDAVELGISVAKHNFSYGEGIKIDYVDPAEIVHSWTEDPNYNDLYYIGEVKQIHITELKKINPHLTPEDLEDIRSNTGLWSNEYAVMRSYNDSFEDKEIVNVLFFNYKTDKTFTWKEKFLPNGGSRMIEKDGSFNPPEGSEELFRKVEKKIDVWYEGAMVLGADKIIKWQLSENMVRPKSAFQKTHSNYVISAPKLYKNTLDSLVRRMMPYADQIQLIHLKLQQVRNRIVPDGVFIDADGLTEIDLGNGGKYNPHEALKLFFQTGSVIGRSYTQDGEFNHAKVPIQEINHNSGHNKIRSLIESYNYYLGMIRDVTGINEARDGSTPDPDALVGVQKLAAANSNVATRHVLDSGIDISRRMAECVSLRISDILEYSDMSEEFAMQIGKYNVALLDDIKDLPLHSFGIFIEVSPDEEEKSKLEENISIALNRDQITIEDVIDIREIKNIKLANELLKLKRKKKADEDMAAEQQKMQMQAEINAQSAQMAAQARIEEAMQKAQAEIQIEQAKHQFGMERMFEEAKLKSMLMEKEFVFEMEAKGLDAENLKDRETYKEDRKDKRTEKQASQQSKMIDQRQTGKPSIDFESGNDTLGGFEMEQFTVR
jgi:hypothetical protein